jgi:hypothetical protein
MNRAASVSRAARSSTCGRLYACDTLLERLPQDLEDMASALGPFIQEEHPMVRPRHVARHRHLPPPISPASEIVWWGARHGRVVTRAVRAPVRPATRWMRVVSKASARLIAGRGVVRQRASSVDSRYHLMPWACSAVLGDRHSNLKAGEYNQAVSAVDYHHRHLASLVMANKTARILWVPLVSDTHDGQAA